MSTRTQGFIDKISDAEKVDTVKWMFSAPLQNLADSVVDSKIKTNAEWQAKAGIPARIVRRSVGKCCEWCQALVGTYEYPGGVPDDVYRRHDNCNCLVEYFPGDGKKQNVHTKAWEQEDPQALVTRKSLGGVAKGGGTITVSGMDVTVTDTTAEIYNGVNDPPKTLKVARYTTPDGVEFNFKKGMKQGQQQLTPREAIRAYYDMPEAVRLRAQKTINVLDIYNPDDSYWKKHYKNFRHSFATGGEKITFWRYDGVATYDYYIRTMEHEAGHYIDRRLGLNGSRYSDSYGWRNAMKEDKTKTGMKSVTQYGENANTEDFAESIALYSDNPKKFVAEWPSRGKIIESILSNTDVGLFI